MKLEKPTWSRIVAQLLPPREWGDTGPQFENILQRSRLVMSTDIGKFAVSVVLPGRKHDSFITPATPHDNRFWTNGLDGVKTLAASVRLFDTVADASTCAHQYKWQQATIYEVIVDPEKANQVLLQGRLWAVADGENGREAEFQDRPDSIQSRD